MRFITVNLGCKVNQAELEKVTEDLVSLQYQFTTTTDESDFAVVNTCTVTSNADKKSLRTVVQLQEMENIEKIFVTGCFTELEKELIQRVSKKCQIVAQNKKMQLASIIDGVLKQQFGYPQHDPSYEDKWTAFKSSRAFVGALANAQTQFYQHSRAFVKIQDGCNAFCSYCRIPFARGGPVSRGFDDIIDQVKKLSAKGMPEIVLTGINLSIYFDRTRQADFSTLVGAVLDAAENSYVRISSLEPHFLGDRFLQHIGHPRLVPHFHLPLQATSDRILKMMGRKYSLTDYRSLLAGIRQYSPLFSISTDIITGYPDETEEEFLQGMRFVESCGFSSLHVFPFSLRPLTGDADRWAEKIGNTKDGRAKLENIAIRYKKTKDNTVTAFQRKWRAQQLRRLSGVLGKRYDEKLSQVVQRVVLEREVAPQDKMLLYCLSRLQKIFLQGMFSEEESQVTRDTAFDQVNLVFLPVGFSEVRSWRAIMESRDGVENLLKIVRVFKVTSEYYRKGFVLLPPIQTGGQASSYSTPPQSTKAFVANKGDNLQAVVWDGNEKSRQATQAEDRK